MEKIENELKYEPIRIDEDILNSSRSYYSVKDKLNEHNKCSIEPPVSKINK